MNRWLRRGISSKCRTHGTDLIATTPWKSKEDVATADRGCLLSTSGFMGVHLRIQGAP